MAYTNALSFAAGYYTVTPKGELELFRDIPADIERKIRTIWPVIRDKVISQQSEGIYSSNVPFIHPESSPEIHKQE